MTQRTRHATPTTVLAFPLDARSLTAPQATSGALEPVSTTFPLSDPAHASTARLGRYANFQLRDFFMKEGVAMTLLAFALALPMWSASRMPGAEPGPAIAAAFNLMMQGLTLLGTGLAVRGIVSDDTQHGYHRFLFSKPLDVPRFYAQALAVRFAGFMAMLLLLGLPFVLLGQPLVEKLVGGALFFLIFGSLGFFLSTVTKHEIGLLIAAGAAAVTVQPDGHANTVFENLKPIELVLPPVRAVERLMRFGSWNKGIEWRYWLEFLPYPELVWVLLYGIVFISLGLAVLRRRAVRS